METNLLMKIPTVVLSEPISTKTKEHVLPALMVAWAAAAATPATFADLDSFTTHLARNVSKSVVTGKDSALNVMMATTKMEMVAQETAKLNKDSTVQVVLQTSETAASSTDLKNWGLPKSAKSENQPVWCWTSDWTTFLTLCFNLKTATTSAAKFW